VAENADRILVIDQDPEERAVLIEAALEPFGYEVDAAATGSEGLTKIEGSPPDVVVLDLHLTEGLSGHDVMAAINAHALDVPVILLANQGAEQEALRSFRLGAKDYIVRPVRETELVQVVERALKEVRLRRDRENLLREVRHAAQQTERHLGDLRTLMSIGKSITALHTLDKVFDGVTRAAIQLTGAETGGVFVRDDQSSGVILQAGRNLSRELSDRLGEVIEDDLAVMVMSSGETYIGSGEGLRRFSPAESKASAVIYAPLVVHGSPLGLLWVANQRVTFREHMKDLMTALADYAAIAVFNARLFATMEARTRQLEALAAGAAPEESPAEREADARSEKLVRRIREPLASLLGTMNLFRTGEMGRLRSSHQAAVDVMYRKLVNLVELVDSTSQPEDGRS
jgi:two-component system NtrC family sensor kinase